MARATESPEKLYTLTEISEIVGLSAATLQRYKKRFQSRIPSVGKGRKQRYPEDALDVFRELKKEGMARRGRPRKEDSGAVTPSKRGRKQKGSKQKGSKKKAGSSLLTLAEVQRQTGISYQTLRRYVDIHDDLIPSQGKGRRKRFPPEATEVFRSLRASSKPGRKPKVAAGASSKGAAAGTAVGSMELAAVAGRLSAIESSLAKLARHLEKIEKAVKTPIRLVQR